MCPFTAAHDPSESRESERGETMMEVKIGFILFILFNEILGDDLLILLMMMMLLMIFVRLNGWRSEVKRKRGVRIGWMQQKLTD